MDISKALRATVVASAVAVAGCGSASEPLTPKSEEPSSAVSRVPVTPSDWGPLAVMPPQDGVETARSEGTSRVTESCVHLQSRDGLTLLYWPADGTLWDAESRTIGFTNPDGTEIRLAEGDTVALGGGGGSEGESGVTREQWADSIEWVARPEDQCLVDSWWAVGAVMD